MFGISHCGVLMFAWTVFEDLVTKFIGVTVLT